jgi:hypothetical protein
LSEGRATSDRVGRKNRNIVRRQGNFGQSQRKKQKHCQKTGQLQTESAEKTETLSEDRATSDRVSGKNRNIVRREDNFNSKGKTPFSTI